MKKFVTRFLIPLVITLFGVGVAKVFAKMKPEANRAAVEEMALLVEVMELSPTTEPVRLFTSGAVSADKQVVLGAEVPGRVVSVSDKLIPGGRVSRGEVLFRVDPRNFQNAITQRTAQVAQAELNLSLEEGRGVVAAQEWELLGGDREGSREEIALRQPQLANAQAQLESARAALAQAETDLERTVVRAPFNAVVVSEQVEAGQMVGSASQLVTLVGTDRARVEAQLPMEAIADIAIPGVNSEEGAAATVSLDLGSGELVAVPAHVSGLVGSLNPQTRSATVVLIVEDPMEAQHLPIMPGAYVNVEIASVTDADSLPIPRSSLYEGSHVWVVDAEQRLERRTVEIGHRTPSEVFVVSGLDAGERLVTTTLSMPIEGTAVRVLGEVPASGDEEIVR